MSRGLSALMIVVIGASLEAAELPGFRPSLLFGGQVREAWINDGVRAIVQADHQFDPNRPTRLIIYATPNGNSIEQTLGCEKATGLDWHYDIQHIAAQVRMIRSFVPHENIVLACIEAEGLSWPAWKKRVAEGPKRTRQIVETIRGWLPNKLVRITLAGHSGGGSFLFGFIDASEAIPAEVERFIFLDANYSYSDTDKHGDKLLTWLKIDDQRRLIVIAYDDREIMLNGKKVIGPDGGTFRASERMRFRFEKDVELTESTSDGMVHRMGLNGRLALHVHRNPDNKILHTALVGEMNGLLRGLTDDWPKTAWGTIGGPRAYAKFIPPSTGIPPRPKEPLVEQAIIDSLNDKSLTQREQSVVELLKNGHFPESLRTFIPIRVTAKDSKGKEHTAIIEVMPDYLSIGSDRNHVRMPMTPRTAAIIAERFGCTLPTKKLVDDIFNTAKVKREPIPMTKDRESWTTFRLHHDLIESNREDRQAGELVVGVKKDIVLTNRLTEKPNRVAIYGWHQPDGKAIQPLTIVHHHRYVDYSHGVRLVKRMAIVDGQSRDLRHVYASPDLWPLVSHEGPIRVAPE